MASKNNLKPKAYAQNNIDRWGYLTGHELKSLQDYTRDQLRAIAYRYSIPNASRKSGDEVIKLIKESKGFKEGIEEGGYQTLFEKVKELTEGEAKSLNWYKNTLKSISKKIQSEPSRMTIEEKMDSVGALINQDRNVNRRRVFPGHMYFFEYKAETQSLPYYDKYPLAYVLKSEGDNFYAANLHYIEPKKRLTVINKLKKGEIEIPKKIIHKYIVKRCKSLFLDLAIEEWITASTLPVEDFVLMRGNGNHEYPKEYVWEEMNQYWSDKLHGTRIIKGMNEKDKARVK